LVSLPCFVAAFVSFCESFSLSKSDVSCVGLAQWLSFDEHAQRFGMASLKFNLHAWEILLQDCPWSELVHRTLLGIKYGEPLGYVGERSPRSEVNPAWTAEDLTAILAEQRKRTEARTTIGGFCAPPFPNFQCSPVFTVPKDTTKRRFIHNLAAPEGKSINDGIDKRWFQLSCKGVDAAIALLMQVGRGALMQKRDWAGAYRQVGVWPGDWELCGYRIKDLYYADTRLPFGCTSSPGIFNRYSDLLQWMLREKFGIRWTTKFYDDHLTASPPTGKPPLSQSAEAVSQRFDLACDLLGITMKPEKREGPTTRIVFLGIILDSVTMSASLPQDKIDKLLGMVRSFLTMSSILRKQIERLQGLQNFACQVVRQGRAFVSRLTGLIKAAERDTLVRIKLSEQARLDLQWWERFLSQFNGVSFFLELEWSRVEDMRLAVDACAYGAGGFWHHRWYAVRFDASFSSQCIREMIALVTACVAWGRFWTGKRLLFLSDNMGVVTAVNKRRVRSPELMQWIRELHFLEAKYSFECRVKWIQGTKNSMADHLSRGRVEEFKQEFRACFHEEPRLFRTAVSLPSVTPHF